MGGVEEWGEEYGGAVGGWEGLMGYVYPTRRGYCTYIHIRQTVIVGCGLGHLITGTTELSICTLENNRLLLTLVVMRRGGYCHLAEGGRSSPKQTKDDPLPWVQQTRADYELTPITDVLDPAPSDPVCESDLDMKTNARRACDKGGSNFIN